MTCNIASDRVPLQITSDPNRGSDIAPARVLLDGGFNNTEDVLGCWPFGCLLLKASVHKVTYSLRALLRNLHECMNDFLKPKEPG